MRFSISINGQSYNNKSRLLNFSISRGCGGRVAEASLEVFGDPSALVTDVFPSAEVVLSDYTTAAKKFRGHIGQISPEYWKSGTVNYQVTCQDWTTILDTTIISIETYVDEDDSNIVIDLFNTYLPEVGTSDFVQTLTTIPLIQFENVSLRIAMERIVELTGGEWYVDPELKLHYYTPGAAVVTFSETPDGITSFEFDRQSFTYVEDFRTPANKVTVVGDLMDGGVQATATEHDYASQYYYDRVWDRVVSDKSIKSNEQAALRAQIELATYAWPQTSGVITFRKDGIEVGTKIGIVSPTRNVNGEFLVRKLTFKQVNQSTTEYTAEYGNYNPDLYKALRRLAQLTVGDARVPYALPPGSSVTGDMIANATITGQNIANATIQAISIVNGTITADQIANATITGDKIANATITAINVQNQTLTAQQIANATITGAQVANQTITANNIGNNTITAGQIANQTITSNQIANLTITGAQMANQTITAQQIANATVTAQQIQNNTITANQIANATITGTQIQNQTITANNIANQAITSQQITNQTITAQQISNATITATQIANQAVTANQIANYTIIATNISNSAGISGTQLKADAGITGSQIANNTITGNNLVNQTLTANQIGLAAITGAVIAGNTITGGNLVNQTITAQQIANATITGSLVANNTVTGNNLVNHTIGADQIANASITGALIANNTVTGNNLVNNTITASQIANATITGSQIANNTITGSLLVNNTITAAQIANATITADQVANYAITAAKLANNTVTANQIANYTITAAQIANNVLTANQIANATIVVALLDSSLAAQVASELPKDANLVAYWALDETTGTTAYDKTGGGSNGTLGGSALWYLLAVSGGSVYFDATSGCQISAPVTSGLPTGNSVRSVCCWIKTAYSDSAFNTFAYYGTESEGLLYGLTMLSDGRVLLTGGGSYKNVYSLEALDDNDWHFIVATYDGTTNSLYVDGELQGTSTVGTLNTSSSSFYIGSSNSANYFKGLIDEVRLYNVVLTLAQVKALYKIPGGMFGRAVPGPTIVNNSITANQIANATITASQIANATVTANQIANLTITGNNIANATITNIKINDLAADKLTTGSMIVSSDLNGITVQVTASNQKIQMFPRGFYGTDSGNTSRFVLQCGGTTSSSVLGLLNSSGTTTVSLSCGTFENSGSGVISLTGSAAYYACRGSSGQTTSISYAKPGGGSGTITVTGGIITGVT